MKKSEFASKLREAGVTNRLMRRVTMKMQLDEIEGFVAMVERGFKTQLKVSERKWKRQPKGLSNDELEEYFNKLSMECFSLDNAFPSMIRQTSFIYLYSVLEKGLMFLCDCAHKHGWCFQKAATGTSCACSGNYGTGSFTVRAGSHWIRRLKPISKRTRRSSRSAFPARSACGKPSARIRSHSSGVSMLTF
jgi:hypothetical protein